MSSPIGGFYLSAQQRQKQRQAKSKARVPLCLSLRLYTKHQDIINLEENIYLEETHEFSQQNNQLRVKTSKLAPDLIQLHLDVHSKEATTMQQTLALTLGEQLHSLMAHNEHYHLHVHLFSSE